jgi:hypothetical protein
MKFFGYDVLVAVEWIYQSTSHGEQWRCVILNLSSATYEYALLYKRVPRGVH